MRGSWTYTAALALLTIVSAVLLRQGVAQSLVQPGDVSLTTDSTEYFEGETIVLRANLSFAEGEIATTTSIVLSVNGPQSLDVELPLQSGVHVLTGQAGVMGQMVVRVDFRDVVPRSSQVVGVFKGIAQGARIEITAEWTPDPFTDAAGNYQANVAVQLDGITSPIPSNAVHYSIRAGSPPTQGSSGGGGTTGAVRTKTPTKTPRPTATHTPTHTATPAPTHTPTVTATHTSVPSSTAWPTFAPSPTPEPTETPAPPLMPVAMPSATATSAPPTATPSPSPTAAPITSTATPKLQMPSLVVRNATLQQEDHSPRFSPTPTAGEEGDPPSQGFSARAVGLIVMSVGVLAGIVGVAQAVIRRQQTD